jgi:hypothetical protein
MDALTMTNKRMPTPRKVTVGGRITPEVEAELQAIARTMSRERYPATVTVSQLVELAVIEFIQRYREHAGKVP